MSVHSPWETKEGKEVWKSKSAYFTWLRGALRKLWSDYPLRKVWKKGALRPVTKEEKLSKVYHPSTKNVGQCVYCQEWMAGSKLDCDHITPSDGCKDTEEAEAFLWYCGGLLSKHFCLACKPCHKIKTHSERTGLTFEEARCDKEAICVCKTKKEGEWLAERGITPASNATKRRKQVYEWLITES